MRSWDDNDSTGFFHHLSKLQKQIQIQTNKDSRDEYMDLALDSFMCQSYKFKYKYKYEKMRSSRDENMDLALDSFIMWASLDLLASLHLVVKEILKGGQLLSFIRIVSYLENYQLLIVWCWKRFYRENDYQETNKKNWTVNHTMGRNGL